MILPIVLRIPPRVTGEYPNIPIVPTSAPAFTCVAWALQFASRAVRGTSDDSIQYRSTPREASYRFSMSGLVGFMSGDMVIRAMASRVLKLETKDTDGTTYDGNGVIGGWGSISPFAGLTSPKLRGFLSVSYQGDPITVTMMARYTGPGVYANGFIECTTDFPVSTTAAPTIENNDIAGMTTLDLSGSYQFESFEMFGTIENLTNHQPPSIGGTLTNAYWQGQGNADYDRVGRQYRMGVRVKF